MGKTQYSIREYEEGRAYIKIGDNIYRWRFVAGMKHVGDWVVIQVEENESALGIISTNENSWVVVASPVPELIGKKVFYSIDKAKKTHGYLFVPYTEI